MSKQPAKFFSPPDTQPSSVSIFRRIGRVLIDAIRGFIDDDCYSKASALTFYSLLSIVPVFAVLFGIAKGFGFEKALEIEINQHFAEQQELLEKLIQFAYSWLQNAQGGLIAGVGTITLLWSVLGLLSNIETALNAIWKTPNSRSYGRKISDYLATMIIGPLFLVTSSSINLFLSTQITQTAQNNVVFEAISPLLLFILRLFPFFLSGTLFVLIYLFMPNVKVYFRSALVAGILAGTAFQIWQWLYIRFQIGVASYGAVYGSFAALPLFLIWLQISWIILLAGAEIAFAIENDLFIPSRHLVPLSSKAAALLITYRCIDAFVKGQPPQTDYSLAHELGMSLNHLQTLMDALQKAHILAVVSSQNKTMGYQPARALESISFKSVSDAVERSNELMASVQDSEQINQIFNYLKQAEGTLNQKPFNQPLYQSISLPLQKT